MSLADLLVRIVDHIADETQADEAERQALQGKIESDPEGFAREFAEYLTSEEQALLGFDPNGL